MTDTPDRAKDFLKLWTGQTISAIGSRITRDGVPLTAVLLLGATPWQMGLLAAASSASILVFSIAAGVIADRMRRRPLMIGTDLARAVLLTSIPLAAWFDVLSFGLLLGIAVAAGLLTVQFDIAYHSYLPTLLPSDDLFDGNRRLSMSAATAEILGPGITGVLVQAITAPRAILLDAVSFVVSAVSLWFIRTPEPAFAPAATESLWREASQGARAIARHPVLRALALRSMLSYFSFGMFYTLYMLYAIRTLHMSTSVLGLNIALGGVGALAGAWLTKRLTIFAPETTFTAAAVIQSLAQLLVPAAASVPHFAVLCMGVAQLIGDAAFTVYAVNEITVRQRLTETGLLGRVNGAMQLASGGVLPIGALAGGVLAQRIGIPQTLWVGAAGVLISTLFLLPLRRNRRAFTIDYGNGSDQPRGRETQSGQE
jgi:predicted MFS family arabinose efflux permease